MSAETIDGENVQRLVEQYLDGLRLARSTLLTPPFPVRWPPAEDRRVVYFAYTRDHPVSSGFSSGHLKLIAQVKVRLEESDPVIEEHALLPQDDLGTQAGLARLDRVELYTAAEALFRAVSLPKPAEADLETIKRTYNAWRSRNSVLAGAVQPRVQSFFVWLEEE